MNKAENEAAGPLNTDGQESKVRSTPVYGPWAIQVKDITRETQAGMQEDPYLEERLLDAHEKFEQRRRETDDGRLLCR